MESSWTNIIYVNMGLNKIEKFRNMYVPCTILSNIEYHILYYILYYVLRKWGSGNEQFYINKMYESLDMNFISIKKHEMEILIFWNSSI